MNSTHFASDHLDTRHETGDSHLNRTERLILTGFMLFVLFLLGIAAWNAILLITAGHTDGGPLQNIIEAIVPLRR